MTMSPRSVAHSSAAPRYASLLRLDPETTSAAQPRRSSIRMTSGHEPDPRATLLHYPLGNVPRTMNRVQCDLVHSYAVSEWHFVLSRRPLLRRHGNGAYFYAHVRLTVTSGRRHQGHPRVSYCTSVGHDAVERRR